LYWCYALNNIPTELEYLTNLREFKLSGTTEINKFPLRMKNWIKLEVLELNEFNNQTIPSKVWMMTKLRHLSLNCNKLSFIPSELSCLSNLTHLSLSSNQITHISNQINKLTQLQFLDLSSNQLTEFPDDISSLPHLSALWLGNYKSSRFLSQLPPNLRELYHPKINSTASIPPTTLSSLTRLESLNLSGNQITILPTQIGLLTSLQYLYLSDNQITILPTQIGLLTSLRILDLSYNKLSFIPSELVRKELLVFLKHKLVIFLIFLLRSVCMFQNLLSNLVKLSVPSNNLTIVPLTHLYRHLKFKNNPFKFPSNARISKDDFKEFFEVHNDLSDQ
jgi:Leucine-rich repeat (LRR) protein